MYTPPMLARKIDHPFDDERYIAEPKMDSVFSRIRYVEGNGIGLFRITGEAELEGIVMKRKDSLYHLGKRSWAWQKVIHWHQGGEREHCFRLPQSRYHLFEIRP
ncbi:hypothetical protein C8P63_12277 [Melghirimyces profundicolus]|uniref:ATP dependent DNA ligase-like protein n=1 Tax=Melghirimyces profundicolus TaxID=1242148 RepID=A0A2T6BGD2_9BACL|nr:hypothetical protein C8P63_12277 [Melghirimyces profundicolus]